MYNRDWIFATFFAIVSWILYGLGTAFFVFVVLIPAYAILNIANHTKKIAEKERD